jgi:hypothetical protein
VLPHITFLAARSEHTGFVISCVGLKTGRMLNVRQLSIATLATVGTIPFLVGGGGKKEAQKTPPINASSKDEEKFIQYETALRLDSSKSILTPAQRIPTERRARRQGQQDFRQGGALNPARDVYLSRHIRNRDSEQGKRLRPQLERFSILRRFPHFDRCISVREVHDDTEQCLDCALLRL